MNEPKLIEIRNAKRVIFVGDTHGDLEASERIIKEYLKNGNILVFLGDYVDRGAQSKENLDFLLKTKSRKPEQIYLLQGNHEGPHLAKFYPADFWESLDEKSYKKYTGIVEEFPFVVVVKNIIALHGVLPDVESLDQINKIELGSRQWHQITWGDFTSVDGEYLGIDYASGRPLFGRDWFFKLMKRFDKRILVRSHQPDVSELMFEDKCLTIFTSRAYREKRTIAIADFSLGIKRASDLEIETL